MFDETHDPGRASWVESADGHAEFPIQNLPHGVFSPEDGTPRGGERHGSREAGIAAADDRDPAADHARLDTNSSTKSSTRSRLCAAASVNDVDRERENHRARSPRAARGRSRP